MNKTKKEHITDCFIKALYYWYTGDKFNGRNAMAMAAHIAKECGYVAQEKNLASISKQDGDGKRKVAEVFALDFPAKRAASSH